MKKYNTLSFQIWKIFAISMLILSIAFSFLFYTFMSNFIKDQIFQSIEFNQDRLPNQDSIYSTEKNYSTGAIIPSEGNDQKYSSSESLDLNNLVISKIEVIAQDTTQANIKPSTPSNMIAIRLEDQLDQKTRQEIEDTAKIQLSKTERYSKSYQGKELLYVIEKQNIDTTEFTSYSYVIKDINKIILSQFKYLYFAIILIIVFMLYPAKLVANKITKPLSKLKANMENIANRDWTSAVKVEGSQEISQLSDSCEAMRVELVEHDKNHQLFLQEISHELKTPIMIINSYIQAIRDGMFREHKLNDALDIIQKETARLEKRSLDLIYITNLDFLKYKGMNKTNLNLKNEIETLQKDMAFLRTDINWELELENIETKVYESIFITALENILNNQVRYAKTKIKVKLFSDEKDINIQISNDGEKIELNQEKVFAPFEKGKEGKSGLGLYISKKIIELHSGNIKFENLEEEVLFFVNIPKKF